MERKTERVVFALTKTERAMLAVLAKTESETIGEFVSEAAIIRKLIRKSYTENQKEKDNET